MKYGRRKKWLALIALLILSVTCSSCGITWQYNPIMDVNDLEGRRVAVNMSWETDYSLTGRKDLQVMRYDSIADMIMSLRYNKVDAIAVDGLIWKMIESDTDGLECVTPSFAKSGYTLYFNSNREALKNEFNAFLTEYKQSEDYQDHLERLESFDGVNYVGPDINLVGTGSKIKVAIDAESFPRAFLDTATDEVKGFDLEALKLFANARDYRVEFVLSDYNDIVIGLRAGIYDIGVGYLSDVYEKEVLNAGLFTSEPMDECGLYFVQKTKHEIVMKSEE